jgi:peptide/nickel transport system substrate-binding protein
LTPFLRAVVLALASLLAGCGESVPHGLRLALAASPVTLDPRQATDATSTRLIRLLYGALVDFDHQSRPVPALAARWEPVHPRHYRFTLGSHGRRFHDGRPLEARDVKATYDSVLDPRTGSPHRLTFEMVERVEAPDPDTVEFYLSRADPLFPSRLGLGVLPADLVAAGHPFRDRPVGSGPFAFVEWPEEGRLRMVRLTDGEPFTFVRVPDPTMRVLKLLRGEVDMLQGDLSPELVGWLSARPELRVSRTPGTSFTYLGFNLSDPLAARPALRRAVALAIDRAAIARYLMGGTVRLAGAVLPPEHWAGHPALPGPEHAPDRARALVTALGYGPGRRIRLAYKTSSDPLRVRLAAVVQHQLREVGIDLTVQSYDWATFYADVKAGRFQLYSLSWVALRTPDIFRYAFHSASRPPDGANRGRYADPQADSLIERAERAASEAEQVALLRALQERLAETLPYVPLWYEDPVAVTRREVVGYRVTPDGSYDGLIEVAPRGRR